MGDPDDVRRVRHTAAAAVLAWLALAGLSARLARAREMFNLASTQRLAIDRFMTAHRLTERPWALHASILLAEAVIVAFAAASCWFALQRGGPRRLVATALGIGLAVAIADHVLKPLVDRRVVVSDVVIGSALFPSGHAAALWASAMELLVVGPGRAPWRSLPAQRPRTIWSISVAAAVASMLLVVARTHYLSDVIGGALLGTALALSVRVALDALEARSTRSAIDDPATR